MVLRFTRILLLIASFYFFCLSANAQVISGTLNYTQTNIVAINANNAEITVLNPAGFSIGDRVLLIQIQGAVISTANNPTFGDVQNYNGAGGYEIATVCGVSGNDLTFDNELLNIFDPNALVQVIRIPQYGNLTISGILTSPAWDGVQGGVLVLEAVSIDLLADIDMSNKGFRGAAMENSALNCSWINIFNGFAYGNSGNGAPKGEGIAVMDPSMRYGKGAAANGGGGGNDHNSGGAGGGNIGSGGQGGTNGSTGFFDCKGNHPGVGGKGLSSTNSIFLGGGGGAGHGNNNLATSGGNGGGIIILIAQTMTGNNVAIRTNGETALNTSYDANDPGGDAAGGGGSGGSVHLDITTITGNVTVEATGGNGGDVVHTEATNDCFGPGGGGAGGVVKFKGSAPGSVTSVLTAGVNGTNQVIAGISSCLGSSQSAASGNAGTVLQNITSVPASTTDFAGCDISLAVELLNFEAELKSGKVELKWTTLSETNNASFNLERSKDATHFEPIYHTTGAGTTSERTDYSFLDENPVAGQSYYRLSMVDFDGRLTYSEIRTVRVLSGLEFVNIFPNPARASGELNISINSNRSGLIKIEVFDVLGRTQYSGKENISIGLNAVDIDLGNLVKGTYLIRLEIGAYTKTQKLILFD